MSYRSWHVGMKVVCIEGTEYDPRYHRPYEQLAQVGCIYTIREIGMFNPSYPSHVTIRLHELRNLPIPRIETGGAPLETFFYAQCFRPLQKRKTDISVFTALLNTTKEREPA